MAACRTPVMDFGVLGNREEERGFETELGFGGGAHVLYASEGGGSNLGAAERRGDATEQLPPSGG
jgi:hypothetical protein